VVKQIHEFRQKQLKEHSFPNPLHQEVVHDPRANMAHDLVSYAGSSSSIPSQLYYRLGLSMPRWLFWVLTIFVGLTLSGLLVSTLALWTPLWSGQDKTEEELGWSKSNQKQPITGGLWHRLSEYELKQPMNILVLGVESVRNSTGSSTKDFSDQSNTILLVRFNPRDKTVRVISIPQDTMISIPDKGLTKVSLASVYGGVVLAARVVSRTLNNAPIHRYIRISTSVLQKLIDQLGGVELFIPKTINYKNLTENLNVSLASGWQTLNGKQALNFVRFREEVTGDLFRVQRQQTLLIALRERLLSPNVLMRLPYLTQMISKYFDTNLKMEEVMALVNFCVKLKQDNLQMTILPGIFSLLSKDPDSYWLDLEGKARLLGNYVGVKVGETQKDKRPLTHLRIALQNSTKNQNLTQTVISYFRKQGFKKVYRISNSSENLTNTRIIAQKGNLEAGKEIRRILGIGTVEVSATGDLESDITIRFGKDW